MQKVITRQSSNQIHSQSGIKCILIILAIAEKYNGIVIYYYTNIVCSEKNFSF